MNYQIWKEIAIRSIQDKIQSGKVFVVKDLFVGAEWENLSKGERIGFGRFFSNEVNEGHVPDVTKIERAKNNHMRYRKR